MSLFALQFAMLSWTVDTSITTFAASTPETSDQITPSDLSHGVRRQEQPLLCQSVVPPPPQLRAPWGGQDGQAEDVSRGDSAPWYHESKNPPHPLNKPSTPPIHGVIKGSWLSCNCSNKLINLRGFRGKCRKFHHSQACVKQQKTIGLEPHAHSFVHYDRNPPQWPTSRPRMGHAMLGLNARKPHAGVHGTV